MTDMQKIQNFDVFEPKSGHRERFMTKMIENKPKKRFFISRKWMMAASILLLFGLSFGIANKQQSKSKLAPEIQKNELYFSEVINQQLKEIDQVNTQETNQVFTDALIQMEILEKAYQKLLKDYQLNRDKYILNAMIENFNQRIEILQFVKQQIEEIKQTKNQQNETYKA
jgi:hypothetical protein